MQN
ncbi:hypothetical protein D039_3348A, partial [Vibrio parahaemolyticus EKP-028]|jgi:hypothetical protein